MYTPNTRRLQGDIHPGSKERWRIIKQLQAVGFEPTSSKWLVPKSSAIDHSATLPKQSVATFVQ